MPKNDKINSDKSIWPSLPYEKWKDTLDTLHLWLQIVGKIKLKQNPFINQWWEVALYPTSKGLTTGRVPYKNIGFDISFDFINHKLIISTSSAKEEIISLKSQTVASFYAQIMLSLKKLGIEVKINTFPSEISNAIPFEKDMQHKMYDKDFVEKWHRIQLWTSFILDKFRSDFSGKSSPVQFFWGGFDLTTTRFSGKKLRDKTDWPKGYKFMRYSENEENFSCGFWPGNEKFPNPAFYSYLYPAPKGCESMNTGPLFSYFDTKLAECIFPYEKARKAKNPEEEILHFFQTTYTEYTKLAKWNRQELDGVIPKL